MLASINVAPISLSALGTKSAIHHGAIAFQSKNFGCPITKYPNTHNAKPSSCRIHPAAFIIAANYISSPEMCPASRSTHGDAAAASSAKKKDRREAGRYRRVSQRQFFFLRRSSGALPGAELFSLFRKFGEQLDLLGQKLGHDDRPRNFRCNSVAYGLDWRKGWDSNPREALTSAGFQDRCLKPLGHPSKSATSSTHAVDLRGRVGNFAGLGPAPDPIAQRC